MKDLRVVYMGTPEFAAVVLDRLREVSNVVLVVSQPDAPVGRKRILEESEVSKRAHEYGIEVINPRKIREEYQEVLDANPDIIVTCAYGQIIPKELLDSPRLGCINVHASLLPKYRGGAPIHRAIIEGESETGITIMYMDEHMDSGDIIEQRSIPITDEDNLDIMNEKLADLGGKLLVEVLPKIACGTASRTKQDESKVTYGYVIKREDELLDFNLSTRDVFNKIRGLSTKPCAYFTLNGRIVKVIEARIGTSAGNASSITEIYKDGFGIATRDGEIVVTKIKPEGKKEMTAVDFLNGLDKKKLKGMCVNVQENQ